MPRVLLIDDEELARLELRRLLAGHADIEIVGEMDEVPAGRLRLAQADYDLVLLDVHLAGGSGFDLVPHVAPGAEIVFVTAHDGFAIRAFEVNALDYLLKPVAPARLADTLRRLSQPPRSATEPPALSINDLVSVKTGPGARRFIRVADIVAITSEDNYSIVWLCTGERHLVRQTLNSWDERLPPSHFLRVHRQNIVNVSCIESFEHQDDETTILRLAPLRSPVRARRAHWPELCARLAALGIHL